ncbi:hypothetical protein HN587_00585 [Candidatus Woesearchaeota archaeon]|jgi:hypothetical protein|nr:hypothetical protein [Candidatus Woesearchaeota archaeon]
MEHFPLVNRLHTDVLEDKYGPIHIKLIRHTAKIREAHLMDSENISRTFAITFFEHSWTSEIKQIDKKIKSGVPIGKAFRENSYAIRKNVIDVFVVKIPIWLKKKFKTKENYAKARLSEFYAKKRTTKPIIYGLVVEIYSPDFRSAIINNVDLDQINATTESLQKVGINMDVVWTELGNDHRWNSVADKILKAKKDSLSQAFKYKQKIQKHLEKMVG